MLETFYRAYVEEKRDGEKLEKRVEALEKDIDNIKKKGESKGKLTTVIICENHQGYIRCDNDETIHIIQANYGRTEGGNICPHASIRDTNCYSTNAKGVVGTKCNGRRECNLESNNGIFGDPCIGTYKYMSVQFTCIPDSTNV
ncbi:L-rhamnose-binding lectin CSL3-like [Saccostrea echinata]|uniref:L-rhamnose-binding lectin CSL3-like n=1 Tax=Saccostrea echinata TaxID=191078 RepID=UPI002A82BC82|nr:L-rhamnose-binding lectin CSL3-like [Saccostrea echinata]